MTMRFVIRISVLVLLLLALSAAPTFAVNDVTIDGGFDDWKDENVAIDPLGDANPDRTDLTWTGIARGNANDGNDNNDIIYLMCATDTADGGGFACVFELVANSSVTTVRASVDTGCVYNSSNSTSNITSGAAAIIPKIHTSDNDDDCAVEVAVPIGNITNGAGNPITISLIATRQSSSGQANNNDEANPKPGGIGSNALTLRAMTASPAAPSWPLALGAVAALSLGGAAVVWRRRR